MRDLDLNLLVALDALLRERSVSAAARGLGLSTSAMSRTLSRLRTALEDPVLVPAGRSMVPTPRAEAIADEVRALTRAVHAVLSPAADIDIGQLRRDFTIRANEAFVLIHAADLSAAVAAVAPGVRLRFAPKPDKAIQPLRDATIDLDIGVLAGDGAELRGQTLFVDDFVGVARKGHPALREGPMSAERYAACRHVMSSRRGHFEGPVDAGLADLGLSRTVSLVVASYPAVLAVAATSDLLGIAPRSYCKVDMASRTVMFELPVPTPPFTIVQTWHPRMDADPGHRWLRGLVFDTLRIKMAADPA
ncbi:LysR family transcriptional regulator [Kaistia algarum]|uniref:LysR family transcriptional regulator n=1 Tax=Kaistia algarum TaxID=2083279 RepID=UPI000CE7E8E4|nr:LysR family transcriptional regulator [Kaistia algarum]MCX5512405.1 LysR family transcriptional regulator [Kaistia algarum]PPE80485.1 LysR family transcriptional regulator [Kaistia algarum]